MLKILIMAVAECIVPLSRNLRRDAGPAETDPNNTCDYLLGAESAPLTFLKNLRALIRNLLPALYSRVRTNFTARQLWHSAINVERQLQTGRASAASAERRF